MSSTPRTVLVLSLLFAASCGATVHPSDADVSDGVTRDPALVPPRPIAPLSTSRVSSHHPTFSWVLPTGTTGAVLEICRDRDCATPLARETEFGTSHTISIDLSPGVYFWRLFGRGVGSEGTTPSATWEFLVGARNAATNTSWGSFFDVNCDGVADVLAAAATWDESSGGVVVRYGTRDGSDGPITRVDAPPQLSSGFGSYLTGAGDVNGDGCSDFVVATRGGTWPNAALYFGHSDGAPELGSLMTTASLQALWVSADHIRFLAGAGDLNGDGYSDIALGDPDESDGSGVVQIWFGSATGVSEAPSIRALPVPSPVPIGYERFGYAVAIDGDLNGDQYSDLVVSAGTRMGFLFARVWVYYGGPNGPSTDRTTLLTDGNSSWFGSALDEGSDLNGDGIADLVILRNYGSDWSGEAHVYLGSLSGIATQPTVTLALPEGVTSRPCGGVATGGDLNGDGFDDFALGYESGALMPGGVDVYFGGPSLTGWMPAPRVTMNGGMEDRFGVSASIGADFNGDGFSDLVVGSAHAAFGFAGSGTGVSAMPEWSVDLTVNGFRGVQTTP